MIPHLHEHFSDVSKAKLADEIVPEGMELPGGYVLLDLVCLFEEHAHIFDEAARSRGW